MTKGQVGATPTRAHIHQPDGSRPQSVTISGHWVETAEYKLHDKHSAIRQKAVRTEQPARQPRFRCPGVVLLPTSQAHSVATKATFPALAVPRLECARFRCAVREATVAPLAFTQWCNRCDVEIKSVIDHILLRGAGCCPRAPLTASRCMAGPARHRERGAQPRDRSGGGGGHPGRREQ